MKPRFFKALSICAGSLLSAAVLALLQAEEYAMVLENSYPQYPHIAQMLRDAGHRTRLCEFTRWQKDWLSSSQEMPELANTLPPEDDFTDEETDSAELAEEIQPKPQRRLRPIFPQQGAQPAMAELQDNHIAATAAEVLMNIGVILDTLSLQPKEALTSAEQQAETPVDTPQEDGTEVATNEGTPTEPAEEPAIDVNHPTNCRIMMVGDSLMEGLGPAIHRTLRRRKELHFILTAKFSTGLCRPDYFNWPERMEEAIKETHPDIVIFFMGANDAQGVFQGKGKMVPFKSQNWREAYGEKVQEMAAIAEKHHCRVIWIGLPPFGGRNAHSLSEAELAQRAACERMGITFVDSHLTLADENGQYRTFMTNEHGKNIRLRRPDMCHMTDKGNAMLVDLLLPTLEATIKDFNKEHPDRRLTEEDLARHGYAQLQVTFKYRPKRSKRR